MRRLTTISAAIGLTLLISSCGSYSFRCGNGSGSMMDSGYGGMFMWIFLLVILGGVAIYWFTSETKSKTNGPLSGETPLDILKKRYAKGEITREEFEKMKKDLEA
jgi:putative membrane protein